MIAEELEYVESPYLVHVRYYEKELFVSSQSASDTVFPVLLMDWVEGVPLDRYLRQHADEPGTLRLAAYRFSRLAMWLLTQPFAHGDIKSDNILMTADGEPVLVDYDGMFVPKMAGRPSRELDSPDYRHPACTAEAFDEHTDDFSLAVLALSLKAVSLDPTLLPRKAGGDGLLFAAADFLNLPESQALRSLAALFYDEELVRLTGLFLLAHSARTLSAVSFRLFALEKPAVNEPPAEEPEEEYAAGELIIVPEGTTVISREQFKGNTQVKCIRLSEGLTEIEALAFQGCTSLVSLRLPDGLTEIGESAFSGCTSLASLHLPSGLTKIGWWAFSGCTSLTSLHLPSGLTEIGWMAFEGCTSLTSLRLPSGLTKIGYMCRRGVNKDL